MKTSGYWAELSADDFRALDAAAAIALLPIGATEQHGPHLPLAVDSLLVETVLSRVLRELAGTPPVLILPTLAVGKSNEHLAFRGTLTLSAETLLRVLMELGECVARAGVRKLVLFNGHGGNTAVLDIAARDLRVRHGLLTIACAWYQFTGPAGVLGAREDAHGLHAGQAETSAVLAVRPDLVAMDKARDFASEGERWAEAYHTIGLGQRPARPGWMIDDLNPDGACGNAAAATAETGERLLAQAAQNVAGFLRELAGMPVRPVGPEGKGWR